jgi:hypothetical protein
MSSAAYNVLCWKCSILSGNICYSERVFEVASLGQKWAVTLIFLCHGKPVLQIVGGPQGLWTFLCLLYLYCGTRTMGLFSLHKPQCGRGLFSWVFFKIIRENWSQQFTFRLVHWIIAVCWTKNPFVCISVKHFYIISNYGQCHILLQKICKWRIVLYT